MKKRFFPLLALLLLLLPAGRAETPYEGYTLDFGYPLPFQLKLLNDHEFLTTGWDDPDGHTSRPGHVTWWRDYRVFRDLPYTVDGAAQSLGSAQFLVDEDGAFKVLITYPQEFPFLQSDPRQRNPQTRYTLYDWTDRGLEHPVPLPIDPVSVTRMGQVRVLDRYVAAETADEQGNAVLTLYNSRGEAVRRWKLPLPREDYLIRFRPLEEERMLVTYTSLGDSRSYELLLLDPEGVRWHKTYSELPSLFSDRRGGFFQTRKQSSDAYSPLELVRMDADFNVLSRGTLRGNRVVLGLGVQAYDAAADRYPFFGSAVANSRQVYTVFRLITDGSLNPISLDVRGLSKEYGDYSPYFFPSPQGTLFVFTHGNSLSPALVPFDALPPATDNVGLQFR